MECFLVPGEDEEESQKIRQVYKSLLALTRSRVTGNEV
jgi:hypothetical protein